MLEKIARLSPVPWENVYHVGVVVPDMERGMEELSRQFGLTFRATGSVTLDVKDAAGAVAPNTILTSYATQGPPYIELLHGPGVWATPDGPRLHHIGVWTDDLAKEVARFEAMGVLREASGVTAEGAVSLFAYMKSGFGFLIELVDGRTRAGFDARMQTDR